MRELAVLITAGGTSENIDDVRRITNSGTGRLGALIATRFAAGEAGCHITYLRSEAAVRPNVRDESKIETHICDSVLSLKEAVERVCSARRFDIVVHSMAVGDYMVRAVTDAERLAGALAGADPDAGEAGLAQVVLNPPGIREAKISSDKDNLVVVLEKAPKIISLLRGLAPGAVITGFKLLSNVSEEELVRVGLGLLTKNRCDFVLANDMRTVRSDRHEGLLIAADGSYEHAFGKQDIASLIVRRTTALAEARRA
ncbi:MAG: phosphopantothenate--cysteine ligase [Clostridiales Family XIII bacterium]|jgi:phosphopantothenate-cysteine ligase|nr:phosphopantothenate--cysteine ligase [Clostridiales Family XIII bacterium]